MREQRPQPPSAPASDAVEPYGTPGHQREVSRPGTAFPRSSSGTTAGASGRDDQILGEIGKRRPAHRVKRVAAPASEMHPRQVVGVVDDGGGSTVETWRDRRERRQQRESAPDREGSARRSRTTATRILGAAISEALDPGPQLDLPRPGRARLIEHIDTRWRRSRRGRSVLYPADPMRTRPDPGCGSRRR